MKETLKFTVRATHDNKRLSVLDELQRDYGHIGRDDLNLSDQTPLQKAHALRNMVAFAFERGMRDEESGASESRFRIRRVTVDGFSHNRIRDDRDVDYGGAETTFFGLMGLGPVMTLRRCIETAYVRGRAYARVPKQAVEIEAPAPCI